MKRNPEVWIVAILMTLIYAVACPRMAQADENDQTTWVKGAVVIGITGDGRCVFKPFIKVDDTSDNPDDGRPQILGYSPGSVVIHNGTVVWERVDEDSFIPLHGHKTVHGRMCIAPNFNE